MEIKNNLKNSSKDVVNGAKKLFGNLTDVAKEKINKAGDFANKNLDVNNDGKVDIIDIIYLSIKIPGIAVNREEYLKSSLNKYYDYGIIQNAIKSSPKEAHIDANIIEKIADETIEFERKCATGASAALGLPGGVAIAATLPTDIIQYFAFLIRAAQKLMYLYGFKDIGLKDGQENIDKDTMHVLEIAVGVMLGVQGAEAALHGLSKGIIQGLKAGSNIIGKFCFGLLGKAVPIIGAAISGGVTYATFKPCCEKLRKELRSLDVSKK